MNTMVYFDPRNDITNDVIFNLNRRYKAVATRPPTGNGCSPPAAAPAGCAAARVRPELTLPLPWLHVKGQGMLKAKRRQRTLAHAAEVRGHGFFHGSDVTLRFRPAEPGTGVVFERADLPDRPLVPARIDRVVPSSRRTTIRQATPPSR